MKTADDTEGPYTVYECLDRCRIPRWGSAESQRMQRDLPEPTLRLIFITVTVIQKNLFYFILHCKITILIFMCSFSNVKPQSLYFDGLPANKYMCCMFQSEG